MIRFRAGIQVWLFTGRMAEVLQLASLWAGRACIDVTVNAIDDAPLNRQASAMRAEAFTIMLETTPDPPAGPALLADFLRGSLDTRYVVVVDSVGVRVQWDTRRQPTPPLANEDEPRR